jgi:RNA polymerase sigma factor (TIGR02999 family)
MNRRLGLRGIGRGRPIGPRAGITAALAANDGAPILAAPPVVAAAEDPCMAHAGDDFAERLAREGLGEAIALREMLPMVYADLKRIAHRQLLRRAGSATLSTTVLVHETYARVAAAAAAPPGGREHFVALCARVMRQVIVDHARTRSAEKRGGGLDHAELSDHDGGDDPHGVPLLSLAEALENLAVADARLLRLVEQHWFLGLDPEELAVLHGLSLRSVQRELKRARAWLVGLLEQ